MPPVFLPIIVPGSPKNHVGLSFVNPGVVLFHRSKDGGLIKLLREKAGMKQASEPTIIPGPTIDASVAEMGADKSEPKATPPATPPGSPKGKPEPTLRPAQFTAPLQPAGKVI
jgi:hypothetical protein